MKPRDDGSPIRTIVFLATDRQPAKLPKGKRAVKQWVCPSCGRAVGADTLLDFEHGWHTDDSAGRWWVKGICPYCWNRIQFTKHGAAVVDGPHTPGKEWKPVRKTIIKRRSR